MGVSVQARQAQATRRPVGVALGGGSARGIAHVGVIRWFEAHRIPIDLVAGTSMGGLVGGGYATGMSADELTELLVGMDWDRLFGASGFAFKNVRRKDDARDYPSRLEFGLKNGLTAPVSLNSGQHVDLLLDRLTAAYYGLASFDDLPTPFRAVAADLLSAERVVLDRGSLSDAMRATMSLPAIFPPVAMNGRLLVDGGIMDNVPADVVRSMGAGVVVAINVGDLSPPDRIAPSMFGVMGGAINAMMRVATRRGLEGADVVIDVPLKAYESLDWRRARDLIEEGYRAAEAHRDHLLPLALDAEAWRAFVAAREARRRRDLPAPAFIAIEGLEAADQRYLTRAIAPHLGVPLVPAQLEAHLEVAAGLDRYESVGWRLVSRDQRVGLLIRARAKPSVPPFLMVGLNLENTTADEFRFGLAARYLGFDVLRSGSELRIDAGAGSDPRAGIAMYVPAWRALFVEGSAGVIRRTEKYVVDDLALAEYRTRSAQAGFDVGVTLGTKSDLRVGLTSARINAAVDIGNPELPALEGTETMALVRWRLDTQDSPAIATRGVYARSAFRHVINSPVPNPSLPSGRTSEGLRQWSGEANAAWTVGRRHLLFAVGGAGASFDHRPLPIDQFSLGMPFRLGSYDAGALRGDHYWLATGGYARQVVRLPDFLGGPLYVGAWIENGDAFDDVSSVRWRTTISAGAMAETLLGPVILAVSADPDGRWRWHIGVGRLFR